MKNHILSIAITLTLFMATAFSTNAATLIVNSSADNNTTGTLRQRINQAASGDTIIFADGINNITLNGTHLTITKNLTIKGRSPDDKITINANQRSRIFFVTGSNRIFNIENLVLTNGRLTATWISMNSNERDGGAVFFHGASSIMTTNTTGTLTATNCNFTNCSAVGVGGAVIFNGTNMIVQGCNFIENRSIGCSGAIYLASGNLVTINSNFHKNQAGTLGATLHITYIYVAINCTFTDNYSPDNNEGTIHCYDANARVYLYHCTFDKNSVMGTNKTRGQYYSYNCIYTQESPIVTDGKNLIEGSTLHKNALANRNLIFGNNTTSPEGYIIPLSYAVGAEQLTSFIFPGPSNTILS